LNRGRLGFNLLSARGFFQRTMLGGNPSGGETKRTQSFLRNRFISSYLEN